MVLMMFFFAQRDLESTSFDSNIYSSLVRISFDSTGSLVLSLDPCLVMWVCVLMPFKFGWYWMSSSILSPRLGLLTCGFNCKLWKKDLCQLMITFFGWDLFLLAAGHTLSDEELLIYILGGLGTTFDAIVVNLTIRGSLPSLIEVQSILHTHKMRLLQHSTVHSIVPPHASSLNPTANIASKDSKSSTGYNPGKSKGRLRFQTKNKVIFQLCGKTNHVAIKCLMWTFMD